MLTAAIVTCSSQLCTLNFDDIPAVWLAAAAHRRINQDDDTRPPCDTSGDCLCSATWAIITVNIKRHHQQVALLTVTNITSNSNIITSKLTDCKRSK